MSGKRRLLPHVGVLLTIFIAIFITNFPFGTWYTGWDNLHPEFNFPLNLKRGFFSVWQENQGIGTIGGHGYAATLPHTIILFVLSLAVPPMYLRSTFTFASLLVGGLGIFFLVRELLKDREEHVRNSAALVGSLFYLLNLATVENFYIQLEAYIAHFAFLPWLFFSLMYYLGQKTRRALVLFLLVSLISSMQSFIPPLFFVYLLMLVIFLLSYMLHRRDVRSVVICLLLTFLVNAYWFLPVSYFALFRSETYLTAYNNLISTDDFILRGRKYGNLSNVILLKGFILEAIDAKENGEVFPIFDSWQKHLDRKSVQYVGFAFFLIMLIGVGSVLFKRDGDYAKISFTIALLIFFSLLATNTFPFSLVGESLQEAPLLRQAFRVVFTKFAIALSMLYAVALAYGLAFFLSYLSRLLLGYKRRIIVSSVSGLCILLLIFFSYPVFSGNFLYARTKRPIPNVYFELFDFFKGEGKEGRIANLPQGWNWGWSIYRWGYSGSGFLWYGIEQPILDRAFDVWGRENENYYWELSYAIYSENFPLIEKIFEKYHVRFVLLDKNIIPYQNPRGSLFTDKLEDYLDGSAKFRKVREFKSLREGVSDIDVFEVALTKATKDFKVLYEASKLLNVNPSYRFSNSDRAFVEFGPYYTRESEPFDVYFPFRTIFTGRRTDELTAEVVDGNESFFLRSEVSPNLSASPFVFPPGKDEFPATDVHIDPLSRSLTITVPKVSSLPTYESESDPHFLNHEVSNCKGGSPANIKQEIVEERILRFTSVDSENCYDIVLPSFPQRYAYLVAIEGRHLRGKALRFAFINHDTRRADIEVELPKRKDFGKDYIVASPMKQHGLGYSLSFNNIAIGSNATVNDVRSVTVHPIPYDFLTGIKIVNQKRDENDGKFLVLYQAFDEGWKAYALATSNWPLATSIKMALPFLFGEEMIEHVLVNNWANGWTLENAQLTTDNSQLVVVYLPQYLEYLGFFLLFVGGASLILYKPPLDKGEESTIIGTGM